MQIGAKKKAFSIFNKQNWAIIQKNEEDSKDNNDDSAKNSIKDDTIRNTKGRRNYSVGAHADKMNDAVKFANENPGKGKVSVAKKFGVSRKSLTVKLNGDIALNASVGRQALLTREEESMLSNYLIEMAHIGFGYDVYQVKFLIKTLLKKNDDKVTNRWFQGFMLRNPELSRRRSQAFDKLRLAASTMEIVGEYFLKLEIAFNKCKELSNRVELTSNRVFAADEIGFDHNVTKGYIITKRGSKHPFATNTSNISHITMMAFAAANGWSGPQFLLLPGVNQKNSFNTELFKHFPEAKVSMSEKGFMTEKTFIIWAEFFIDHIKDIRGDFAHWCLLVIDGHHSHVYSKEALNLLNKNNILAVCLSSHVTSMLQIHDVCIFHPLKEYYRQALDEWKTANGLNVKLIHFPKLLQQGWAKA